MIKEVVTHGNPAHLDELVAYIMLRDYGQKQYPSVSTATLRYLAVGDNLEALANRQDIILLGLGAQFKTSDNAHRILDEHVVDGDNAHKKECAATLAAKGLGLDQQFRWGKILKYVLHTDKNPPNLTLDLATTVMRLQRQGWEIQAVLEHVEVALNAALTEADQFAQTSLQNIRQEQLLINGDQQWMAVIEGDHPSGPAFARMFGAAVVVVKNPSGHVQILTTNHLRLDMRNTIRILRLLEQKIRKDIGVTDWANLEQEGLLTQVPEWFFHKEARNILNGGRSRPDVPPTKLPLSVIIEAVQIGLESKRFQPERQEDCRRGVCTSTPQNPCPWYQLGLFRCRAIRAKMSES